MGNGWLLPSLLVNDLCDYCQHQFGGTQRDYVFILCVNVKLD